MISTQKISWRICNFLVLVVPVFVTSIAQSAPKNLPDVKEVVVTNYVGNEYAKQDTPEYIARTVLRSDGTALYFGNPTYAPRKGQFKGTFAPSYFTKINAMLRSVFAANHQDEPRKNITTSTRTEFEVLAANGKKRHIIHYESAPNKTLSAVDSITYGLTWKIKWQPYVGVDKYNRDLSGVRGDVLKGSRSDVKTSLGVPSAYIIPGVILSLRASDGKEVARGTSDKAGKFCIVAPPGSYFLVPKFSAGTKPQPYAANQSVTVNANGFSDVTVDTMPK